MSGAPVVPLPWSFSSLNDFAGCPYRFYRKRVIKDVKEETGEAGEWGNLVHEAFDAYLKREIVELPTGMRQWTKYLDEILSLSGELKSENKMAITKELKPCGFFDKDVWCRGVLDVIVIDGSWADIQDHKTGKRKEQSSQLAMFALLAFYTYPQLDACKCSYNWLGDGGKTVQMYSRCQIKELWGQFLPDLKQYVEAFKTNTWQCRPSGLCNGWCPVEDCQFWKPKRRI